MKDIFNIANEARASISNYCINICHSKCCKTGFLLLLGRKEVEIICGENEEKFIGNKILMPSDMGLGFKFDLEKQGCKYLNKDFKCQIHTGKRPRIRADYPVFKAGDYYVFADNCPAVKAGLLEEYKKKFERIGIRVV